MLRELHISGLGVIEDLDLELHEGLNVLTGETGAGKTMITVGLALALGARGAASLVRPGASAARVQARFDAPVAAADWAEDGEVVHARTISADGKQTARVSGQIATASVLAEIGGMLVELHGQHQAQRLLSTATQTAFLDRYAGDRHVVALAAYREAFERWQRADASLREISATTRDREREADLLAYQVREIEAVAPAVGESEALATEATRLGHVERLLEQSAIAERATSEDGGPLDGLGAIAAALDVVAGLDPSTAGLAAQAHAIGAELSELARETRSYRESLAADPERVEQVRERIAALKGLQRKYGATDADVLAFHERASTELAALTGADRKLEQLESEVGELRARAEERAGRTREGRSRAAPKLAKALAVELHELGMPGAMVEIALIDADDLTSSGSERVELRFSAGAGQPAQPLAKTASGGELSRTMLACRSLLADLDEVPTLVFDEVDAGIGGEAGLAVGRRLARLAEDRQVVVVTHLPQIACFADRHISVAKHDGRATARALSDEERVAELARMLAGMSRSELAASHAEELLDEARRVRTVD